MILTFDHANIRELRLNRPPVNALSTELMTALRQAVQVAPGDGIRALVLSGSPGRFSAGLDVPLLLTLDRPGLSDAWHELYALLRALATSPIPIIAAITGHAPAGGTVLPLMCDYRVLAEGDFKLGVNEVQVGIPLPPVILEVLRRQVGARHAEYLAVSGTLIGPQEALRVGLVDQLAAPDRVLERALEAGRSILAVPRETMTATRRRARADLVQLFERDLDAESREMIESWWSQESQSALRALAQRLGKKAG